MTDDRRSVGREPHVKFDAVAAVGQSVVERRRGIFRNRLQGAGTPVTKKERARTREIHARRNQSRSKSRSGLPVSGVSFAFLTASWNFFSNRLAEFLCASTDCWKIDSLRPSCSFIAFAASLKSANIFGAALGTCEITAFVSGSTFSTAPQQGQVVSKMATCLGMIGILLQPASASHPNHPVLRAASRRFHQRVDQFHTVLGDEISCPDRALLQRLLRIERIHQLV